MLLHSITFLLEIYILIPLISIVVALKSFPTVIPACGMGGREAARSPPPLLLPAPRCQPPPPPPPPSPPGSSPRPSEPPGSAGPGCGHLNSRQTQQQQQQQEHSPRCGAAFHLALAPSSPLQAAAQTSFILSIVQRQKLRRRLRTSPSAVAPSVKLRERYFVAETFQLSPGTRQGQAVCWCCSLGPCPTARGALIRLWEESSPSTAW